MVGSVRSLVMDRLKEVRWSPCRTVSVNWRVVVGVVMGMLCLSLLASSLPFSAVYSTLHSRQTMTAIADSLNQQRSEAAREYFRRLPKRSESELAAMSRAAVNDSMTLSAPPPGQATFTFTVVIITTGRRRRRAGGDVTLGYVLQSAAALDTLVRTEPLFSDAFLLLCNVDPSPDSHHDAALLRDYLPYVERYGRSVVPGLDSLPIPGTDSLYRHHRPPHSYDKERSDYTFCLQAAMAFRAQHYLVFQEDAVPLPDFPAVLQLTLAKLTKAQACRGQTRGGGERGEEAGTKTFSGTEDGSEAGWQGPLSPSFLSCASHLPPYTSHSLPPAPRPLSPSPHTPFGYLKLYFPERWQGWAWEGGRLLDLASVGGVGGGLALLVHALLAARNKATFDPSWAVFLAGIVLGVAAASLVGRHNLNELRRASRFLYRLQPAPSCCIPAMLYPAPVLPFLVTWLTDSPAHSVVDLRISDFMTHHAIPCYYIEPNIVRHVGMVTSLTKTDKKPLEEFVLFR